MKEREKFGSRLGFILVSAGCAVGLGNVWIITMENLDGFSKELKERVEELIIGREWY